MKAEPGIDIWLCGGAHLAASLVDEINESILKINPILLGAGIPLFAGPIEPHPTILTRHPVYPNGFSLMHYCWSPVT
jgi:dihydrofolate reductase